MKITKDSIYRIVFWAGFFLMIAASFTPLKRDLHKITFGPDFLKIHFDQVLHAIVYFLICAYFAAGRYFGLELFRRNPLRKFLISIIGLALLTEVVQLFLTTRTFNPVDILANFAGIAIGLGLMKALGVRH